MRSLLSCLLAATALAGVSSTYAADLDYGVLRGPEEEYVAPVLDWSGFYIGGHGGYTTTSHGYRNRFSGIANDYFRKHPSEVVIAPTIESAAANLNVFEQRREIVSYGGYVGYNFQYDDFVLGLEIDYTRSSARGTSHDSVNALFFDDAQQKNFELSVSGIASTELVEYGTARVRAGYAFGSFLPFITGGVAVGHMKVAQGLVVAASDPTFSRLVSDRDIDGPASNAYIGSFTKTKLVGGVALGGGLEYALTSNIILRGEYQYLLFDAMGGSDKPHQTARGINVNTVRAGAAVKF